MTRSYHPSPPRRAGRPSAAPPPTAAGLDTLRRSDVDCTPQQDHGAPRASPTLSLMEGEPPVLHPRLLPVVAVCLLALAAPAQAGYLTQTVKLNLSNDLADGVTYGTVKVEAYDGVGAASGGLSAGQVRLTYTADPAPYDALTGNFGFHTVGFNTKLSLK